jgi:hypothetical protein
MYEIRRDALAEGRTVSRDNLTKDECMKSLHIGNVYRQLDPSSRNMAERIIEVGDQGHVEVCCEYILLLSSVAHAFVAMTCLRYHAHNLSASCY